MTLFRYFCFWFFKIGLFLIRHDRMRFFRVWLFTSAVKMFEVRLPDKIPDKYLISDISPIKVTLCHFMSFRGHSRRQFIFEWLWYRYSCTLHVTLSPINTNYQFQWMIMVSIQYNLIGCQSPDICQTKFQKIRKFLSIKGTQKTIHH